MAYRRNNSDENSSDEETDTKKLRYNDNNEIEGRLESLICRVGDKTTSSSLEINLQGLASVLIADLSNHKTKILTILCDCIKTLPERMTVYSTLVGLLNVENYNAGGDLIEMLVKNLRECLRLSDYTTSINIFRFLADLVNCRTIMASSLIMLYTTLLDVINEENIPQVRSDWYVFVVISSLPWVGRELLLKKPSEFDQLMITIDGYMKERNINHLEVLQVWSSNDGLQQEEYLDAIWRQIKELNESKWEEMAILRPYIYFEILLRDALQHTIPTIIIPPHQVNNIYPLPRVLFRLFDYSDVPENSPPIPKPQSIERFVIEEYLHQILHVNCQERKDCADALLSLNLKFKTPLNYMIVEVIFDQLFQLPIVPHLEVFYGSLLIELCKLQPSSMPQVLAQATEILYDRLDVMNITCIDRFSSWFAYHLSNFQFKWSWDDWSDCLEGDIDAPKSIFVIETLKRCLRLSYHQRIIEIMPDSFSQLLPPKPDPIYKYEAEGASELPGLMVSRQVLQAIKSRCESDEVRILLRHLSTNDQCNDESNLLKVDVFVQTLMFLASKTLSHSFAAISKYHTLFKLLGDGRTEQESRELKIGMLCSLFELWRSNPQMLIVIIDKLLKTQIIECSTVIDWIFLKQMQPELMCFYMWEIINSTLIKMNRQVNIQEKLYKDIKTKREAHLTARENFYRYPAEDIPMEDSVYAEQTKLQQMFDKQQYLFIGLFRGMARLLDNSPMFGQNTESKFARIYLVDRIQEILLSNYQHIQRFKNNLDIQHFNQDTKLMKAYQQLELIC